MRTKTIWAALAALTMTAGLVGCGESPEEKVARQKAEASRVAELTEALVSEIRYEVTGETDSANITIKTPDGTRTEDVDVPLKSKAGTAYLEFVFSAGDFVYLSAQNQKGYGSVTCRITTEDGDVIAENTAQGGYAIATCSGKSR